MVLLLVIGMVISTIIVIGGGLLGLLGFVAEAPREFAAELDPPATHHPIDAQL